MMLNNLKINFEINIIFLKIITNRKKFNVKSS